MYLVNPTGIPYGSYALEEGCPCICSEGSQSADEVGLEYDACMASCECTWQAWVNNHSANMDLAFNYQ